MVSFLINNFIMKIKTIIALFLIVFFAACNCDKNENTKLENTDISSQNALLSTNVVVKHLFPFQTENEDWLTGFDSKNFTNELIETSLKGELTLFDYINTSVGEYIPMSKEEVVSIFTRSDTIEIEDPETFEISVKVFKKELNRDEISQLFFTEEWFLDKDNFKMTKEVLGYGLVREFYRENDVEKEKLLKKVLFELNFNNDTVNVKSKDVKKKELLAENIKYEFNLDNENWVKDLDHERFMNTIIEKITKGEIKVYDFYDNSKVLSVNNIKVNLNLISDTIELENFETSEITTELIEYDITPDLFSSYIFIEDWYIDKSTYKIIKEIKGIAPVYHYYKGDEDAELMRKIPFVVWFN